MLPARLGLLWGVKLAFYSLPAGSNWVAWVYLRGCFVLVEQEQQLKAVGIYLGPL
jgi:hypothetical protein